MLSKNQRRYRTPMGFLYQSYINLRARAKRRGLPYCSREEFYAFGLGSADFQRLFHFWLKNGCPMEKAPSVDRRIPERGYVISNIRWMEHGKNSRRQTGKVPLLVVRVEITPD